jgi:hypothetical protein
MCLDFAFGIMTRRFFDNSWGARLGDLRSRTKLFILANRREMFSLVS